jgi:hypothetical protein
MEELSIGVVFVGLKNTISINPSGHICFKHTWAMPTPHNAQLQPLISWENLCGAQSTAGEPLL